MRGVGRREIETMGERAGGYGGGRAGEGDGAQGGERGREPVSAPHLLSPTSPLPLSPVSLL